ncbi:helix-turn-helix transcriptional regulator [Xenorhabdus bovienii]|uniref:AlpA family phage regulatory protein n=1 Tax=Xenorhabdus bovienii TaxID=40576 RepID=A0AAJ1JES9_XENBV|nr:AlpA family phage regulatory protein [Xenorhabdus bovienii]MDE1479943.1 AlpA family phage regulatory protein [Xenorhabdus bovienii]MDE1488898.1 AlpA family phage regulatory protein [Xenorhabdus bovienii]MDE1492335.1 AlpA family phage regulatory protein [Xenorhabdus bovienii]MDE1494912.1 AlpA family phage regulatory protein [Xenorhabdus bovienii]MDE9428478.1 AlpA family phage regulatory protein [Xenorhabdus bovienii]
MQEKKSYSLLALFRLSLWQKQVKIGIRSIAFIESEVDGWIAQRIVESRGEM